MADALHQFLRSSRLDRRMAEHEVLAAWGQVLGPAQAARARAVRVIGRELSALRGSASGRDRS